MIGQEKLKDKFLNKSSITELPHASIFVGKFGAGKKMLCKEIADNYNLKYIYVQKDNNNKVNGEFLDKISNTVELTLFVIDRNIISTNEESALLKFIEEPSPYIYIIILCETLVDMFETIVNRCQVFYFEPYSRDILETFYTSSVDTSNHNDTQKEILFKIADTPGKVMAWNNLPLIDMKKLVVKIFDSIYKADISNILTIPNKIKLKENSKSEIEIEPFIELLHAISKERVIENIPRAYAQYMLTEKFYNNFHTNQYIYKAFLFEHYLYELKGI